MLLLAPFGRSAAITFTLTLHINLPDLQQTHTAISLFSFSFCPLGQSHLPNKGFLETCAAHKQDVGMPVHCASDIGLLMASVKCEKYHQHHFIPYKVIRLRQSYTVDSRI